MASKYMGLAKKLQTAIKHKFGINLLLNTTQWHHKDKDICINVYTVKQSVWNKEKNKQITTDLYTTYSQIQLVLYLRDMWYELNGWEVPTDNETWENIKHGKGADAST